MLGDYNLSVIKWLLTSDVDFSYKFGKIKSDACINPSWLLVNCDKTKSYLL